MMHILVLDHDHTNALAHAIQLSGYGLVVETVQDIEEAALRLSTMEFDAVLCNVDNSNDLYRVRLFQLQETCPGTDFYTREQFGEFFGRFEMDKPGKGGDRLTG